MKPLLTERALQAVYNAGCKSDIDHIDYHVFIHTVRRLLAAELEEDWKDAAYRFRDAMLSVGNGFCLIDTLGADGRYCGHSWDEHEAKVLSILSDVYEAYYA